MTGDWLGPKDALSCAVQTSLPFPWRAQGHAEAGTPLLRYPWARGHLPAPPLHGHPCSHGRHEAGRPGESRHVLWLGLPGTSPPPQEDGYQGPCPDAGAQGGPGSGPRQPAGSAPSESPALDRAKRMNIIRNKTRPKRWQRLT